VLDLYGSMKYSRHLKTGNYLVLRHQPQDSDALTPQQDTTPVDVEHHEDRFPRALLQRPLTHLTP
jgi:hypothetical protein